MDRATIDRLLDELVGCLDDLPFNRVIVFGSAGRGETEADSDIDLAIVVDRPTQFRSYDDRLDLKVAIRNRIREINRMVPVDLLVYTAHEYEQLAGERSFLSDEVLPYGRTLYAKAG